MGKLVGKPVGKPVSNGTYVDDKGYLRISAGPLRGTRVHTLVAMAKLGRKLRHDEAVHHKDGNKLNPHPDNLEIMHLREHNALSIRQYWANVIKPRY